MRILLVALLLLAAPTTVHAECAWVLWQEHRRVGTSWQERTWIFDRAYTTRPECEKFRSGADVIAGGDNDLKSSGRKPDDGIRRFYQCVPDTIDPRGPKGK